MRRPSTSKLLARIAGIIERQKYRFLVKPTDEAQLLKKFSSRNQNRHDFIDTFRENVRHRFFVSDLNRKEFYVNLMTSIGGFDSIMDDADLVHENKFRGLNSGMVSFGEKIDWHLDTKSGKRWPLSFYTKIDVSDEGGNFDIRIPWELSRFHQAIWLGRAYWISHSEAHAEKFKGVVNDWLDNNPVAYGVNWVNSVEAAIRAVNLTIGLMYFIGSKSLDDDFVVRLLCSLYDHGAYLEHSFVAGGMTSKTDPQNSGRLISNSAGLLILGIFFYDAEFGSKWAAFARDRLELEIQSQVYEDGTCREKSLGRQRFAAELLTIAFVILRLNDFEVSNFFCERLEKMFDLLFAATAHDGKVPMVGEFDERRVFKLKSETDPNDSRDLLAVGTVLFNRGDFKHAARSFSDLALLLLGTEGFEKFSNVTGKNLTKSVIFKEGGLAFLKTEKDSCVFNFGGTGEDSRSQNNLLSFTISGKHPFIVERGETGDKFLAEPQAKQRLIYTPSTMIIDYTKPVASSRLWFVRERFPSAELLNWNSSDEQDVIEGTSRAYGHISRPVILNRKITFNKRQRTFLLEDAIIGTGTHQIEMIFNFSPRVNVIETERNYIALEGAEFALIKFRYPITLGNWEYSSGYGMNQEARFASMKFSSEIPLKIETFIFILSSLDDIHHILNSLK